MTYNSEFEIGAVVEFQHGENKLRTPARVLNQTPNRILLTYMAQDGTEQRIAVPCSRMLTSPNSLAAVPEPTPAPTPTPTPAPEPTPAPTPAPATT